MINIGVISFTTGAVFFLLLTLVLFTGQQGRSQKNALKWFSITSTCTPVSEFETHVFTLISYKFGVANHLFKTFLPWYTRQVIQQDVEIMENQGKALKETPAQFKSTPADALHIFIESLREHAEDPGNTSAPKPLTREVTFWI